MAEISNNIEKLTGAHTALFGYSDTERLAEISNNIEKLTHILCWIGAHISNNSLAQDGLVRGRACLSNAQASLMVLTHRHDPSHDHSHHGHDHGHDGHHGHDGDGGCSQCESDSKPQRLRL